MNPIDEILNHKLYIEYMKRNKKAEENRVFCRHDLTHSLDVARIAYILALEEKLDFSKELIYSAALLHDIGRWIEYETSKDHAKAGGELARAILNDNSMDEAHKILIERAIMMHRTYPDDLNSLSGLLYRADKLSRLCYSCAAIGECKKFKIMSPLEPII